MLTQENTAKLEAIAKILGIDIASEVSSADDDKMHEAYNEMIDEVHDYPKVGHCSISPSAFLEEHDPIAYNVGFSDWLSSQCDEGEYVYCETTGEYLDSGACDALADALRAAIEELD